MEVTMASLENESQPNKKLNTAVIFQGDSLSGSFKKMKMATRMLLPQDGVIAVQCNNLSNIPSQGRGLLIAYFDENEWRLAVVMKITNDSDEIHCYHLDDEGDCIEGCCVILLADQAEFVYVNLNLWVDNAPSQWLT